MAAFTPERGVHVWGWRLSQGLGYTSPALPFASMLKTREPGRLLRPWGTKVQTSSTSVECFQRFKILIPGSSFSF